MQGVICGNCQRALQADWNVCPFCGRVIATVVESPTSAAMSGTDTPNPFSAPLQGAPEAATLSEARWDLAGIGTGLIVLGVLGFLGCIVVLFSGNLHSMGSVEDVQAFVVIAGGIVVTMVIAGTSIFIVRGSGDTAQRGAMGLLGGLLAAFMIFAFSALWILAAFIYLIEDCLRGCK